jgi:hypothetical protein
MMTYGQILKLALDRFAIHSFEHSQEGRQSPRRWWVFDMGEDGREMRVVQAASGYEKIEDARLARHEAAAEMFMADPAIRQWAASGGGL